MMKNIFPDEEERNYFLLISAIKYISIDHAYLTQLQQANLNLPKLYKIEM